MAADTKYYGAYCAIPLYSAALGGELLTESSPLLGVPPYWEFHLPESSTPWEFHPLGVPPPWEFLSPAGSSSPLRVPRSTPWEFLSLRAGTSGLPLVPALYEGTRSESSTSLGVAPSWEFNPLGVPPPLEFHPLGRSTPWECHPPGSFTPLEVPPA